MFSNFVNKLKAGSAELKKSALKFKNKGFLDKTMAGCALVAFADGEVTKEEKIKMMKYVEVDDVMSIFDTSDVIASFKKWVDLFEFDVDVGRTKVLKELSALKSKEDEARTLIRILISIGAADGDFDEDEKSVVRDACIEMGLSPAEFQL